MKKKKAMSLKQLNHELDCFDSQIEKMRNGKLGCSQRTKSLKRLNKIFPILKAEIEELLVVGLVNLTKEDVKQMAKDLQEMTNQHREYLKKVTEKGVVNNKSNVINYIDSNITSAIMLERRMNNLDVKVQDLVKILERNKTSICLGSAHTFYEEIRKALQDRRDVKSELKDGGDIYVCRTAKFEEFLRVKNITNLGSQIGFPKNEHVRNYLRIKSNVSNDMLYERDIRHFIEIAPKQNLRIAYLLIKELLEVNSRIVHTKKIIALEKNLFVR